MAKVSFINRQTKREAMVSRDLDKRAVLKAKVPVVPARSQSSYFSILRCFK